MLQIMETNSKVGEIRRELKALRRGNNCLGTQLNNHETNSEVVEIRRELEALRRENNYLRTQLNNHHCGNDILEFLRGDRMQIPQISSPGKPSPGGSGSDSFQEVIFALLELDACFSPEMTELQRKDIELLCELNDELKSAKETRNLGIFSSVVGSSFLRGAGFLVGLAYPPLGVVFNGAAFFHLFVGGGAAVYGKMKSDQLCVKAHTLINEASRRFQPVGKAVLKLQEALNNLGYSVLPKDLEPICNKDFAVVIKKAKRSMYFAVALGVVLKAFEIAFLAFTNSIFGGACCSAFGGILQIFISCNSPLSQEQLESAIKDMLDQLDVMHSVV